MTGRIAVISSGIYSMGHALIGCRLAEAIVRVGYGVCLYSDQAKVLRDKEIYPAALDLEEFYHSNSEIVILDTIPLRRQDLLFDLTAWLLRLKRVVVCGHTGWLPLITDNLVKWWRELLAFLRIRTILVYHSVDVCQGRCHIAQLSRLLGVKVCHSGLLCPDIRTAVRTPRTVAVSMGGGADADTIFKIANDVAQNNQGWSIELFVGPYAKPSMRPHPRISMRTFSRDYVERLCTFAASISRAGYGTVVDHIYSRTPVMLVPLRNEDNPEQALNAAWGERYLSGIVLLDARRRLKTIRRKPPALPQPFDWIDASRSIF